MNAIKPLRLTSLVALLAAAALAVGACGSGDGESSAGNGTDLAFIDGMVPHHESAIEMARIAQQRGDSQFVKNLARDIVSAQQREITIMSAVKPDIEEAGVEKADLGVPEHLAGMEMDTTELKTADPFDRAFIDMMVPHHQGAIRMARVELAKGKSKVLKQLAQDVVKAQAREINAMNEHRTEEFGGPSPAGGVPADAGVSTDGGESHNGGHSG